MKLSAILLELLREITIIVSWQTYTWKSEHLALSRFGKGGRSQGGHGGSNQGGRDENETKVDAEAHLKAEKVINLKVDEGNNRFKPFSHKLLTLLNFDDYDPLFRTIFLCSSLNFPNKFLTA